MELDPAAISLICLAPPASTTYPGAYAVAVVGGADGLNYEPVAPIVALVLVQLGTPAEIADEQDYEQVKEGGRGDWTRTSDLYVPNVARYQLRHTPTGQF